MKVEVEEQKVVQRSYVLRMTQNEWDCLKKLVDFHCSHNGKYLDCESYEAQFRNTLLAEMGIT